MKFSISILIHHDPPERASHESRRLSTVIARCRRCLHLLARYYNNTIRFDWKVLHEFGSGLPTARRTSRVKSENKPHRKPIIFGLLLWLLITLNKQHSIYIQIKSNIISHFSFHKRNDIIKWIY